MGRTSIQVSDELADELYARKDRGESYEDVIWRLLEQVDNQPSEERRHEPEPGAETTPTSDGDDELGGLDLPATVDPDEAADAITAARDYLRENDQATKGEIVAAVMPDYPLGYDVDGALEKVETSGERYRGAWWRKVVSPGLETLDDVEKPTGGRSKWRYTGSNHE